MHVGFNVFLVQTFYYFEYSDNNFLWLTSLPLWPSLSLSPPVVVSPNSNVYCTSSWELYSTRRSPWTRWTREDTHTHRLAPPRYKINICKIYSIIKSHIIGMTKKENWLVKRCLMGGRQIFTSPSRRHASPWHVWRHIALHCITACFSFWYNRQFIAQLLGRHENLFHPENSYPLIYMWHLPIFF